MEPHERIILPLDVDSVRNATGLVQELYPVVGLFKIGLEFINTIIASLVDPKIKDPDTLLNLQKARTLFELMDSNVFWDGKFNDIPNTVGSASVSIARLRVKMFSVHASAGRAAVVKAVEQRGGSLVLGVTVLTSLDEPECVSIFGDKPSPKVMQFAHTLVDVGVDGIICSPQELELLGQNPKFAKLIKVTPGIRPAWAALGDHRRVMTPGEAIRAGADYLVIGEPITAPPPKIRDRRRAARMIAEEIEDALESRKEA